MTSTKSPVRSKSIKHPVDQILPVPKLAVYGIQHVLAFYAGAVVVPILLAGAIGLTQEQLIHLINADLFTCGIASIIQSIGFWKVGVKLPLLQGVTFTAVSPMIAIAMANGGGTEGLLYIYGAVIVAGLFTFFIAPFFAKLIRFFPPVVTGTVITIIGIALLPVAALDAVGGGANPDPSNSRNLAYAMGTLAIIVIIQRVFKGFMATVAVLAGLVIGTAVAFFLGDASFGSVSTSPWFEVTTPFFFGIPKFSAAAIISMIVVMLITAVETTGDVFATGEIVEKRVGAEDVSKALRADGLSTFIGGVLEQLVRWARVALEHIPFFEGIGVEQELDPFPGGELALLVLARCALAHLPAERRPRFSSSRRMTSYMRHLDGSILIRARATWHLTVGPLRASALRRGLRCFPRRLGSVSFVVRVRAWVLTFPSRSLWNPSSRQAAAAGVCPPPATALL